MSAATTVLISFSWLSIAWRRQSVTLTTLLFTASTGEGHFPATRSVDHSNELLKNRSAGLWGSLASMSSPIFASSLLGCDLMGTHLVSFQMQRIARSRSNPAA